MKKLLKLAVLITGMMFSFSLAHACDDEKFIGLVAMDFANRTAGEKKLGQCAIKNASNISVTFKSFVVEKNGFIKAFENEDEVPAQVFEDWDKFLGEYCS